MERYFVNAEWNAQKMTKVAKGTSNLVLNVETRSRTMNKCGWFLSIL